MPKFIKVHGNKRFHLIIQERKNTMNENKPVINYTSPDLSKMKKVIIDAKTSIYIPIDADPKAAKEAYLLRVGAKKD